jgi:hypothetical protein
MHAQQFVDERQASSSDAINGDSSISDEHVNHRQEPLDDAMREMSRLLEIVSLAKRRPMPTPPTQRAIASPSTVMPYLEMPPPVIYSRKKKGSAGPRK